MNKCLDRIIFRLYEKKTGRHCLEKHDELNETQWSSYEALLALQYSKLQYVLEYAYQYVPYYRRTFDEAGFKPGDLRSDVASLSKLPILTKSIIRENWNDLQTTELFRRQRMHKFSTAGSTGQPLLFMRDCAFRDVDLADVRRHLGWAGWKAGEYQAWMWGRSIHPGTTQKIRTWMFDWLRKQITINTLAMTDQTMTAFARRIRRHKASILYGYASSLHQFAKFISQSPFRGMTFKGIFSTAEILPDAVRNYIEDVFQCRVFDRYGTRELGGIACECEAHTGLHVSMENNYIEILCNGQPTGPGEAGNIVITNLFNLGMPFIRYEIGDRGAWWPGENCPCGRAAPMLQALEGRITDSFQTCDGKMLWGGFAFALFTHPALVHPSIRQFQFVQKSLEDMLVRLVPEGEVPQIALDEIAHATQSLFGENVAVRFEFSDAIPPLPSGKHQYVVSELK